ncbi:MAG: LuxR C-terminal-related transcriptional regulator [Pigmentiphaga sp.]
MSNPIETTKHYLLEAALLVVPAQRVLVYEVDADGQPIGHLSSTPNQHWGSLYRRFAEIDPLHPRHYTAAPGSVFGTAAGFGPRVENEDYVSGFRSVLGVRFKAEVFLRDVRGHILAGIRYARFRDATEFTAEEMTRLIKMQRLFSCTWSSALSEAKRERLLAGLTEREHEVLELLQSGYPNDDIAARLSIALPTVKNHVKNILGKTGHANRAELLAALLRSSRPMHDA